MKKLFALLLLGVCAAAFAQTPAAPSAYLSWTAPTTFTDGTAIGTATITYNVYQGASTVEQPYALNHSGTSYVVPTAALPTNGTLCWLVTAIVNGVEGAKSNEVCKTFGTAPPPPTKTPNAPLNLKVY